MPNFKENSGGGPSAMKMYGKGKNPIKMTAAQETLPEDLKAGIRAEEEKDSGFKMYGKSPMKKVPNMNDAKVKANYEKYKDNPEYRKAMNKLAGGQFSYDAEKNEGTTRKPV